MPAVQTSGRDAGEALAILRRCHADVPHEGAAQRVGIGKPAMRRDLLGCLMSLLEKLPRRVNARLFDPRCGRHPDLAAEQPREVARAQIHAWARFATL